MKADLFKFWAEADPTDKMHPRDKSVLDRVQHGFDLECLPACFDGPLLTAKVVLLFLSPGLDDEDREEGRTAEGQARYVERRQGNRPLPSFEEHSGEWKWIMARTRAFALPPDIIRHHVAYLNIGAYHSARFTDEPLLAALPSSRASMDWAQEVLFPQAINGERIVVCLRSKRFWGLDKSWRHGVSLFAPPVTRAGYMKAGMERNEVIKAVRSKLA